MTQEPTPFIPTGDIPADPDFSTSDYGGRRVLRTPVKLGIDNASEFKESIGRELKDADELIIDMRDSVEAESSILGVLGGAVKRAAAERKNIVLGGPLQPIVEHLLESSPLAQHVKIINLYQPASEE